MKLPPPFPERYWQKFSTEPVVLKPFDSRVVAVADRYVEKLKRILADFSDVVICLRGSSAWGILGKGDVEIGVFPSEERWFEIIVFLSKKYGGLGNLDDEYARLNDCVDDVDIEIILQRGLTAEIDRKLHAYLREHPELLREYEEVKRQYCFSQREYNRAKDAFFRRVVRELPS